MGVAARIAVGVVLVVVLVGSSAAAPRQAASLYSGPGFDTCSAPPLTTMQSWLASPYRAVGIYVGGINRACPDGNLSPSWAASVVSAGWNLLPLYVGLQAPCVSRPGLALINPSRAAEDGAAAADDAVARASSFGLGQGAPIYFDMEGYKTNSPPCTQAVQAFLGGWVSRLRGLGYLAGVYGSAASTIRDLIPLALDPTNGPDAVWIANWNANTDVFGDPYVPDSYWANHQRLHQYTGGHKETYAGVTVNIDSNTVDGPVVGPGGVVGPPTPAPPPPPQGGSLTTSDGQATVSWPSTALPAGATVIGAPSTLPAPAGGFAAGSYILELNASNADGTPVARFTAPFTVTFHTPPANAITALSADGTTWQPTPAARATDGSLTLTTQSPGSIGLLRDIAAPTPPRALTGRFVRGRLVLGWKPASDNSGQVASYEIKRNAVPLATAAGTSSSAAVRGFSPTGPSVFRLTAVDATGNSSRPSGPVVVRPTARPASIPHAIPNWAFQLAAWQQANRNGKRPPAPRQVPGWYWRWHGWRLHPFHVAS